MVGRDEFDRNELNRDAIEFSFLGIRGRASGRFAIIVLAGLLVVAMSIAFFSLH
jgi:hypothetical protein